MILITVMITRSVGAQLRRPSRRGAQRSRSRFSRVSQGTAAFPPSVLYPEGEESIRLHRSGTGEPLLATPPPADVLSAFGALSRPYVRGTVLLP